MVILTKRGSSSGIVQIEASASSQAPRGGFKVTVQVVKTNQSNGAIPIYRGRVTRLLIVLVTQTVSLRNDLNG